MSQIEFKHHMAAHCESGTVAALLNHAGLEITEPMVFGISSGIFFGYFSKMPSLTFPTFIVRNKPGQMRKNIARRLGVKFATQHFSSPEEGKKELDRLLDQNIPVGVQVDFFYMNYLPSWYRVHINMHYITVVGKNEDKYIVSDCYFPQLAELDIDAMQQGRFARGNMAPKGFLFYPVSVPKEIDYPKVIRKGIKNAIFFMLKTPVPFIGIKGIQRFSKKVVDWPNLARNEEHLSHEIMKINVLLEDQGTGGAGFRYMYATFLRQSSEILNNPELLAMAQKMMEIGDGWREISLFAARIGKNRDMGPERMKELSHMIYERSIVEKEFFTQLNKIKI